MHPIRYACATGILSLCCMLSFSPIRSTWQDGRASGSGTKTDPLVITARYYYYGLDKTVIACLDDALSEYKHKGRPWKLKVKDRTIYVLFDLSAIRMTNAADTRTAVLTDTDKLGRFGNFVAPGYTIDRRIFGGTTRYGITVYVDAIREKLKELEGINDLSAPSSHDFITGILVHELGHSLGGNHGDADAMKATDFYFVPSRQRINGSGATAIHSDISKVGEDFLEVLITRIDSLQGTGYQKDVLYLQAEQRYEDSLSRYNNHTIADSPRAPILTDFGTCCEIRSDHKFSLPD